MMPSGLVRGISRHIRVICLPFGQGGLTTEAFGQRGGKGSDVSNCRERRRTLCLPVIVRDAEVAKAVVMAS